jgi:hypothetical protein
MSRTVSKSRAQLLSQLFIISLSIPQPAIFLLLLIALHAASGRSYSRKRMSSSSLEEQQPRTYEGEDWEGGSNYDTDEVKQITIERKVPVPIFVEKIRHVPVTITKPIFIERRVPIIHVVPRLQNYHHHHYTEFHHVH